MNVTLIAGYFPPEQSADVRLNYDLANGLAEHGINTTVIVPYPTRGVPNEKKNDFIDKKDEQISDNLRVIRVGKPGTYHQGLIRRGLDFALKTYSQYKTAKKIKTDVYLVISTPPFLGYVAALLAKKHNVIFKLQDMFPDSMIYSGKIGRKNFFGGILKKAEKWVYRKVTRIVAVSDDIKNSLIIKGVPEEKIDVIYDWVDENKCYPVERKDNYLFEKFKLSTGGFYVCYAGNIGFLQNIGTIVKAAEIVSHENKQIKFIIIGDGSWKSNLDEMLAESEHDNIVCFPMQPTDSIAYVYSLGDIGIVSLKSDITQIALPSKTWDILSAGRPAICEIDRYSCLCKIIEEEKCGYCVSPGDAEGMAEAILKLYSDHENLRSAGERGRKYIEKSLTKNLEVQKYVDKIYLMEI